MNKKIEEAARQHAELNKNHFAKVLADFGKFCIAHQWTPVDERLPEPDTMCLVFGYKDFGDGNITRYTMMAWYDGEGFYDAYDDRKYRPEMWMPIPRLPKLTPPKE